MGIQRAGSCFRAGRDDPDQRLSCTSRGPSASSKRGVAYVRSIHGKRWSVGRPRLAAIAVALAVVFTGVLIAFAQAPIMSPPAMVPGPGATIAVSWETVPAAGANDTTYTLSYDTTFPFTATQTVETTDTFATIDGLDGVTYYAIVQADDGSGVLSPASDVAQATADGTVPLSALVATPASPNGTHGWYTSVAATITVEDTGTGLQTLTVNGNDVSADTIFGLPPDPSVYPVTLTEGTNSFSFFGTDVAGNIESPAKTGTIRLDSTVPTCAVSVSSSGPTTQSIAVGITAGDATPGSGVDRIEYAFLPRGATPGAGTVWTSVTGATVATTAPEGRLTLFARSVDVAGNVSALQHADVFRDLTAPVTTLVTSPSSPTGPSGSWLVAPGITLNVADADPNTTTYYSWNNAGTIATVGNAPVVPTGPGVQTLRFFSVDTAGNVGSTQTRTFLVQDQQQYTITPSAGANGSISPSVPQTVAGGSNLTFTMSPASGYRVADILVDGVSVGAADSYAFTGISADRSISVAFTALPTFTIVPSAGAHGAISPATTQTVASGSDATFTITPNAGYHVVSVLVDGLPAGAVTSYTFHNVAGNHTISATFAFTLLPTRLSIYADHTRVTHGHRVKFHGNIAPNMPNGTHIGFYVKKPGSSKWIRVSTRSTFSSHHWSYSYVLKSRGNYYFQVRFSATSKYAASMSRGLKVVSK
jgi:hypothetical protein